MTQGAPKGPEGDGNQAQTPLQRAVLALAKMKAKLDAMERAANEPVAIIGLGCRFPGGGDDPESFWGALLRGVDGVKEIPAERWPADAVPDAPPETRWAGLVDHFDAFDAGFFGIAPREAESLDPQQRLLLEVAWETLEDAGIRPSTLEGSSTGVFVGATSLDYRELMRERRAGSFDAYCTTGNLLATAAGRVSYVLGLQGPAIVTDTACSSSLVAIHLACKSLRGRECDLALAGGVNMLLSATGMALAAATQALSADGRCRTLDAQANGFVRAEGCGLVALKRLSDAERDGDEILAIIRGSAVNQDGRSTGLTAPNVLAQQALLRSALENANLQPSDIDYVELHGTGTALGDPIEYEAIKAVIGQPRKDGATCVLGAVKTNIGHLESAAGAAGLIKAVLSLRNEAIPRNLHFRTLNPRVSLRGTPFVVPVENLPWPRSDRPRRAGVSSFGISGTNAHIVVEEAPSRPVATSQDTGRAYLVPLSGRSRASVVDAARALAKRLGADDSLAARDLAYTAALRREHHRYRAAVVGASREELREALSRLGAGESAEGSARGEAPVSGRPKVVFVLPGQGSQWLGMGRELVASEPVFREALTACDEAIREEAGFSVLEQVAADESASRLREIDVVQPMLFAMEVALGALWRSWGVEPDEVIGHSMGEVAAAYLSGILSMEDAAKIICRRSKLLRRQSGRGAMALVELSRPEAESALQGRRDLLDVAVSNGPRATVISGDPGALDALLSELETRGVFCRRVKVDVASHSPQMDELTEDLLSALSGVKPRPGRVALRSTVTGEVLAGPEMVASYWVQNLRRPVLFSTAVTRSLSDGPTVFVELSPHPLLLPSIAENVAEAGKEGVAVGSTRRNADERRAVLGSLAEVYTRGVPVDWSRLFPEGGRLVRLPPYAWAREKYWVHSSEERRARGGISGAPREGHPLIGQVLIPSDRTNAQYWEQWIDLAALPYLADHRVQGTIVFPGAAYIEMALAAAGTAFGGERLVLENVVLDQVLHLTDGEPTRVQLAVVGEEGIQASIVISSWDPGASKWTRHGWVNARTALADDALWQPPHDTMDRCPRVIEGADHYTKMAARRIDFGPAFQGLLRVWVGDGEALGHVRLPEAAGATKGYHVHPALLDACLQASAALLEGVDADATWVPAAIERFQLLESLPLEVWVHARWAQAPRREGTAVVDLLVTDEEGRPLVSIERLWLSRLARLELPDSYSGCVYVTEWFRAARPGPQGTIVGETWLVLCDDAGVGHGVANVLRGQGARCVEVGRASEYRQIHRDKIVVDPSSADDFERLLRDAALPGEKPVRGVVHLLGLDAASNEESTSESILADIRLGCVTALHAAHALIRSSVRDPPRLYFVTRGAQAAGGDGSLRCASQAALWGFARVLSVEHPEITATRIDLDPEHSEDEIEDLAREILARDGEDQVAFRDGERLVARLERESLPAAPPPDLFPDATYLITGGLTGLGLALARWMVARGARHLVLLGRRSPTDAARDAIAEMEGAGAIVRVRSVDVSVPEELGRALAEIKQDMPEIRGVVHSAAVLEDHPIFEMSEPAFWPPILPKVLGAWNLHTYLGSAPLDFFLLYSSGAALLGSPGQANYAAANAFVDAVAHVRHAMGLPATSIQWGPFSEVGLAAASESRGQRLSLRGIRSFTPDDGHELIARLLQKPLAEVGLLRLSVRQLFDFYPRMALAPFLERVREEDASVQSRQTTDGRFRHVLQETAPSRRRAALEQHLIEHVERVLRLPAGRIDPMGPFLSYGMDSLMSLEIRHRVEASLNLRLSAAVLYTYPNVSALVDHLLDEMGLDTTASQPATALERFAYGEIVDEITDNTAAAMLDEKLHDLEDYLK